jgi:hypothetical protein
MAEGGWHRESNLRDFLFEHPEVLFNEPVDRKHREFCVEGKFIDLMFEIGGVHYIIELKRDQVSREAVGQVLEYYGRLRRLNPKQVYRVMLVAPKIPEYRRLPLEEFGIRCVEVAPPQENQPEFVVSEGEQIRSAFEKTPKLAADMFVVKQLSFAPLLPPCSQDALRISHKLLLDSLSEVQREFSQFEIRPVRMMNAKPADILCLQSDSGSTEYMRPGVWWAFAFGKSEHMPKNDRPNISVNAYPWGLDFAINAELRTSQRALLDCVSRAASRFDELVKEHDGLELQLWMKLEHQPRFYHWVLLEQHPVGEWNSRTLMEREAALQKEYMALKEKWLYEIFTNQKSLSEGQRRHMGRRNQELNLAIRLVRTFRREDKMWNMDYEQQLEAFNACYCSLLPLVEFFN